MAKETWLTFNEFTQLICKRYKTSIGAARALFEEAYKSNEVRKTHPAIPGFLIMEDAAKGRRRPLSEVITENRLEKDDVLYWADQKSIIVGGTFPAWEGKAAVAPAPRSKRRSRPRRDQAKEAVQALWPEGVPSHLEDALICKEVDKWLKADNRQTPGNDTILRAVGRRKT